MTRLLSSIKNTVLPAGPKPRVIAGGICAGLKMNLDFRHNTQMYFGLFERELAPWFKKLSAGIRSAADVGTANGFYSLYFMGKTHAEKVLSFDPLEESRRGFAKNMELNGWTGSPRIEYRMRLVGASDDGDTCTLDSFEKPLPGPCMIKMDVEGTEEDVLKGAKRILARPDTRLIIEIHSEALEKSCSALLKALGYETRMVRAAWWRFLIPEYRFGYNCWLIAAKDVRI